MTRYADGSSDWLDRWLEEGNSIENSDYYREKQDDKPEIKRAAARARTRRVRVDSYITNRDHRIKLMKRFIIARIGEGSYWVGFDGICTPLHLRCTGKICNRYGASRGYAIDRMLAEEGRILPGSVYVYRTVSKWVCITPELKRFVKRLSNRTIRRYRGELGRGRSAHRVTAREYTNLLY